MDNALALRYLLDTNILSEPMRPAPDPGVMRNVRDFASFAGLRVESWFSAA